MKSLCYTTLFIGLAVIVTNMNIMFKLKPRLDALEAENKRLVDHHKVHDKMFEIILAKLYPDHGERFNPPDLDTIGIRWFKPHIIPLPPTELPSHDQGGE